jgi:probable 2-oxoglutarate dehydrogenase E1 component DHKTD1
VVFVSGKLYYDLQKEKTDRGLNDRVALIRIEVSESKRGVYFLSFLTDNYYFVMKELCPFPKDQIKDELDKYRYATEFVWCQEEPENAGAYGFMAPRLSQMIPHHKVKISADSKNRACY